MMTCFANANEMFKISMFESRIDSSLFNKKLLAIFDNGSVKSNASIQYARIVQLKDMSEKRKCWQSVDKEWSYFETTWKSKSYNNSYLFIFSRKKVKKQYIVYSQLHLFEPCEFNLDYKVIVTNKTEPVRRDLLHFLEKFLSRAFFLIRKLLKKAQSGGWNIVSMKRDFRVVFRPNR